MPAPLRVQMLIDSLTWGGAEMLLADLAAGAPDAGIEMSVAYLSAADGNVAARRLARCGIEPEAIPVHVLLNPASVRSVRNHLARRAPDLVHTHLQYADMLGVVAARSLGIRSVSTVHVMRWGGDARERARAGVAAFVRRRW
ncbi:MAG: glycosyltransferase, partial [Solirubrobacteraceae bacterium]